MIYLEQTSEPQEVRIPRNLFPLPSGEYVLTLQNTIDRSRVTLSPSEVTAAALCYRVTVAIGESMPAGEYSYEFRKGKSVLAVGIVRIGDYIMEHTQYQPNTTYRQYEG